MFNQADFDYIKSIIKESGKIARDIQKRGFTLSRKADKTILTQADLEVQNFLVSKINQNYKEIVIVSEEQNNRAGAINENTLSAIMDPIDGSAVFSMQLPTWSISIGFFQGFTPIYGFVYSPGSDMLFYNDDSHAYLNDEIITVNGKMVMDSETNIFVAAEIYKNVKFNFNGKVRNLGSTALHACLVADNSRNRTLAFYGKCYLWDIAGAIPILLKAGANIKYMDGREFDYRAIINNGYIFKELIVAYSIDDFDIIKRIIEVI